MKPANPTNKWPRFETTDPSKWVPFEKFSLMVISSERKKTVQGSSHTKGRNVSYLWESSHDKYTN